MDRPTVDLIRGALVPGEQFLWAGRPRRGLVLQPHDVFLIPFMLLWGGTGISIVARAMLSEMPWFFILWCVFIVLAGLFMMLGRFWVEARRRSQTLYVVTSERVIVISGPAGCRVNSVAINMLTDVTLTLRKKGTGTITFGPLASEYSSPGNGVWPWYEVWTRFELSEEARCVYETIREAQRAGKQA